MLKVVVDATPLLPKPSGVGLYIANLIQALEALQTEENFRLGVAYQPSLKNWLRGNFAFPPAVQTCENLHFVPLPVRVANVINRSPNLLLDYFERSFGYPDILHGTNYVVYPYKKGLKVMTIYDITFIKHRDYANSVARGFANQVKHCLQWTDLVLTISESSKRDIVEYLHVPPEQVHVTPLASRYYPDYLHHFSEAELQQSIRYDFSQPYILFVSTIEPRKNIVRLVQAFNRLKQEYKLEHQLVLIGRRGWYYEPIFAEIERSPYREQIHHLDYLSDELVALFYAKADVFAYPSHYEGFGLPALEAMTLGTPVVTSHTSSLPEVVGDAALLIDPNQTDSLVDALLQVVSDRTLRAQLIRKGREQASRFSWENTARETLKAYRSLIQ